MAISIRCANATCRKPLRVKDEAAGKRVKCPGCGHAILVPAQIGDSPPDKAASKSRSPDRTKPEVDSSAIARPRRTRWLWVVGATVVCLLGSAAAVYFYNPWQRQSPQLPPEPALASGPSPAAKPNPETKPDTKPEAKQDPAPLSEPEPKPLPMEVRTFWKQAGAQVGWMEQSTKHVAVGYPSFFTEDVTGVPGLIPAFRFPPELPNGGFLYLRWRPGLIPAELPAPEQPFGLHLSRVDMFPDAGLKELTRFKHLRVLTLYGIGITDEGLKELAGLRDLRVLTLQNTQVRGTGLRNLTGAKHLQWLTLSGSPVTDAGLKELAALKGLEVLYLDSAKVTDAGLKELAGLQKLRELYLDSTDVTDVGLRELVHLKQLKFLGVTSTKTTKAGVKELEEKYQRLLVSHSSDFGSGIGNPTPDPKAEPTPKSETWQKDPAAFAGLYFGGNLKKRTAAEARDLTYPKDVEKKVAGFTVEWIGKVLPGPGNKNMVTVTAGEDGTILIRGTSGYRDGDRFFSVDEQVKSLPILTSVKITMKIRTPVNALIAFDGGPMLILDGDDAKVSLVKGK